MSKTEFTVQHGTIRPSFTINADTKIYDDQRHNRHDYRTHGSIIRRAVEEAVDEWLAYLGWRRWGNKHMHVDTFDLADKYMCAAYMRTQCSFQVDKSLDWELKDYNKALYWIRKSYIERECDMCFVQKENWSWHHYESGAHAQVMLRKTDAQSPDPWDIHTQFVTQSIFNKHHAREYKIGTICDVEDDLPLTDLYNMYCLYIKQNER